jgi:hypothetical protein
MDTAFFCDKKGMYFDSIKLSTLACGKQLIFGKN